MQPRFLPEQIELWEVDRLIPSARNARTHSAAQIKELAASMQAFGIMSVVFVDADGCILAGHARVLAARHLGLARVPVIVTSHLSETERLAFGVADNKIALNAGWNNELLRVNLEALKTERIDLALLGFSESEFAALADELERSLRRADEDAVPDVTAASVSRPGDEWEMDGHRLVCRDATDLASYAELLGEESAHMAFADCPYNVSYSAPAAPDGAPRHSLITNDALGKDFGRFLEQACKNMLNHTRGALYICMSSSELHTLHSAFTKAGGHWSTFIIWGKNTFTLGRSDLQRQYEPILYGWPEGQSHYWCGARDQGDLWLIDRPHVNDLHPTMKPIALVERAILNSSRRGEIVLDPFAGSGSTLIACEKTERKARLMEIEPAYCDVIVKRWQEFTGKQAIHAGTGKTFADLAEQRAASKAAEVKDAEVQDSTEVIQAEAL